MENLENVWNKNILKGYSGNNLLKSVKKMFIFKFYFEKSWKLVIFTCSFKQFD